MPTVSVMLLDLICYFTELEYLGINPDGRRPDELSMGVLESSSNDLPSLTGTLMLEGQAGRAANLVLKLPCNLHFQMICWEMSPSREEIEQVEALVVKCSDFLQEIYISLVALCGGFHPFCSCAVFNL